MSAKKRKRQRKDVDQRKNGDEEESFADRAIQAELDHAMGIANPDYDWLVDPYR